MYFLKDIKRFVFLFQWFLPCRWQKTKDFGTHLYNVNFVAEGGRIYGLLGNSDERSLLIDLIVGSRKNGIVNGDITLSGSTKKNN